MTDATQPIVGVLMGSDSDLPVMAECCRVLEDLRIPHEVRVLSAHRTPDAASEYARTARDRGLRVLVAGAGAAAHLAGAMAAHSTLPVIGVPIDATPLAGFDALLATVQMPPGIPVACVAVGKMGATNAGYLAAQVLAVSDPAIADRLGAARREQGDKIRQRDAGVPERLRELLRS